MYDPYRKRREKAVRLREKRMGAVDFSLPVDGDVAAYRMPSVQIGTLMESLVADLSQDRSPFFDEVRAHWRELFPDVKAQPGKWVSGDTSAKGGKLFLYVRSAASAFALRPKLPAIRKRLSVLDSAPARFTLHIEISGRNR